MSRTGHMPLPNIVVIGASAGGLDALLAMVTALPPSTQAAILVVVHTRKDANSYLAEILARRSQIAVTFAQHGDRLEPGRIYVAPPNVHMLVDAEGIRLRQGPRENGFRPAIDPLFRTAARAFGSRVTGVILSGMLDDGTYGLKQVKQAGGTAIVQDPEEAAFPSMPQSAIRYTDVDYVLPARGIGEFIGSLRGDERQGATMGRDTPAPEPQDPAEETEVKEMNERFGPPSGLTCPDCGGALWEVDEGRLERYRCHVGHQFTIEGLDAQQQDAVESALWSAVRVLEERAALRERMATRAEASGMAALSSNFSDSAVDSKRQAHTIRELLFSRGRAAD